jgi:hypothetical protein
MIKWTYQFCDLFEYVCETCHWSISRRSQVCVFFKVSRVVQFGNAGETSLLFYEDAMRLLVNALDDKSLRRGRHNTRASNCALNKETLHCLPIKTQ